MYDPCCYVKAEYMQEYFGESSVRHSPYCGLYCKKSSGLRELTPGRHFLIQPFGEEPPPVSPPLTAMSPASKAKGMAR